MLLTTSVGSLPKPDYLLAARGQARKGQITAAQLKELEERATREWIAKQEELGIDIIVDGEQYRGDMVAYFAEQLGGFKTSELVRSYGNRYYRKPIITGAITRPRPVTLEWWKFAQALTDRPVKGMLTGPYTIMDWSFNEYYPSRKAATLAIAKVVREEARDLEAAGAQYIQIDEPAISTRPEEMDLAIEALGIVTRGLRAKTITHICYGDFQAIGDKLERLPVDQIDLEFANRDFELLEFFKAKGKKFTKDVGLGVVDVHTHAIEPVEQAAANLRKALKVFGPDRIYVDPDCGLKTRSVDEAIDKLRVCVEAAKIVRAELGNGASKAPASRRRIAGAKRGK